MSGGSKLWPAGQLWPTATSNVTCGRVSWLLPLVPFIGMIPPPPPRPPPSPPVWPAELYERSDVTHWRKTWAPPTPHPPGRPAFSMCFFDSSANSPLKAISDSLELLPNCCILSKEDIWIEQTLRIMNMQSLERLAAKSASRGTFKTTKGKLLSDSSYYNHHLQGTYMGGLEGEKPPGLCSSCLAARIRMPGDFIHWVLGLPQGNNTHLQHSVWRCRNLDAALLPFKLCLTLAQTLDALMCVYLNGGGGVKG